MLILDDSTSAVDTKTDAMIRRAFREEIPDTTKFIIAQRMSSIEDADKILVMDGGKIAAMGTHDALLKTCGIYRETYESQRRREAATMNKKAGSKAHTVRRPIMWPPGPISNWAPRPGLFWCWYAFWSVPSPRWPGPLFLGPDRRLYHPLLAMGGSRPTSAAWCHALVLMACLYLVGALCALAYNRIMVTISQGVQKKIRDDLFGHMQTLPIKYFDTHAHGDVMSVYTNDVDTLRQMLAQSIPQIINSSMIHSGHLPG